MQYGMLGLWIGCWGVNGIVIEKNYFNIWKTEPICNIIFVVFTVSLASGRDLSKTQVEDFSETVGVPPLLSSSTKIVAQVRSTSSGSSGDQSDDDEAETEANQNMDPADAKRMKRYALLSFVY